MHLGESLELLFAGLHALLLALVDFCLQCNQLVPDSLDIAFYSVDLDIESAHMLLALFKDFLFGTVLLQ
jgi:hypothetical protein